MTFNTRNYALIDGFKIYEIPRAFPTNKQMVGLLTLAAVSGSAIGFGVTLALKRLGKLDFIQGLKNTLVKWFMESGGRKIYWYTEKIESSVLEILEPMVEQQALEYHRDIAGSPGGAAILGAMIEAQRNILCFVIEKPQNAGAYTKYVKACWLYHQDDDDQFFVCNDSGQEFLRFDRRQIANIFHVGNRPCIAVRIYPDTKKNPRR
jgi:hypothetical protein